MLLRPEHGLVPILGRKAVLEQQLTAGAWNRVGKNGKKVWQASRVAGSLLVNVPAHIALDRAYLAQFRGDAEATAAYSTRALAECGQGEWLLSSTVQGFLAVAE